MIFNDNHDLMNSDHTINIAVKWLYTVSTCIITLIFSKHKKLLHLS